MLVDPVSKMSFRDKSVEFEHATVKDTAKAQKPQGLREMWRDFGDVTTMHGLGKAIGSRPVIKRIVWTLFVMAATGYAIHNLIAIFQEFSSFPVSTTVGEEYEPLMVFPAVTICNTNQIRKSKAPLKLLQRLDDAIAGQTDGMEEEVDLFLKQHTELYRVSISHSLKEMLITCKIGGRFCDHYNFTDHYNMNYGTCFTFNEGSHHFTSLPGPSSGLILEMNIQEEDYLPTTPSAGIKVIVHPQNQMVFPEDEGFMAAPGFATSIGLKRVEIVRSPAPYGQCVDSEKAATSELNMFTETDHATYTDKVCKKTCYQTEMYRECNCCDIGYPCLEKALQKNTGLLAENGIIPSCNTSLDAPQEEALCLLRVQTMYKKGSLGCLALCEPACKETRYAERISMSRWPREVYYSYILKEVKQTATSVEYEFENETKTAKFVENNLLRVEIFYEKLNYETIVTTPVYDWNRLLSDVGGQLGLWLGFSVMTGLEWVEFLMDAVLYGCRKLCGKRLKTTPVQSFR